MRKPLRSRCSTALFSCGGRSSTAFLSHGNHCSIVFFFMPSRAREGGLLTGPMTEAAHSTQRGSSLSRCGGCVVDVRSTTATWRDGATSR
ncbi:hypothetical protein PF010_g15492 [Phytophthora fragariae]|uniref:Uncharacterized protein n=1 Tax=Phytophthora fragariae TaxID=53985 RepID=A0A6A4CAD8_9STRA|nr:hypothetical protein PF003_g6377 [Phytophthora fragariae]KAE8943770.1 hypothetical protein PF009_g6501 [Phytophthora fragariae]KAE9098601.1 hypothetical protein PF010_g15492 [Phytophthora fragariae]KAE9099073.1 hypothetical protein PF007_g16014 [Phytophthora fragariae]KAE9132546.1 hypothetical protein PF006_g15253 [Phytophthora fragariae]